MGQPQQPLVQPAFPPVAPQAQWSMPPPQVQAQVPKPARSTDPFVSQGFDAFGIPPSQPVSRPNGNNGAAAPVPVKAPVDPFAAIPVAKPTIAAAPLAAPVAAPVLPPPAAQVAKPLLQPPVQIAAPSPKNVALPPPIPVSQQAAPRGGFANFGPGAPAAPASAPANAFLPPPNNFAAPAPVPSLAPPPAVAKPALPVQVEAARPTIPDLTIQSPPSPQKSASNSPAKSDVFSPASTGRPNPFGDDLFGQSGIEAPLSAVSNASVSSAPSVSTIGEGSPRGPPPVSILAPPPKPVTRARPMSDNLTKAGKEKYYQDLAQQQQQMQQQLQQPNSPRSALSVEVVAPAPVDPQMQDIRPETSTVKPLTGDMRSSRPHKRRMSLPKSSPANGGTTTMSSFWRRNYYTDLFLDGIVKEEPPNSAAAPQGSSAVDFLRITTRAFRDAISSPALNLVLEDNDQKVFVKLTECFDKSLQIFERLPYRANDPERIYPFIEFFMITLREVREGCSLFVPLNWVSENNEFEYCAIVCLYRATADTFNVAVVNNNKGLSGGLDFHPVSVDTGDGATLRNIALEIKDIPCARVYNTAFW